MKKYKINFKTHPDWFISNNKWHHFKVINREVYVDGELQTKGNNIFSEDCMNIFSEYCMFNKPLSNKEIKAIFDLIGVK